MSRYSRPKRPEPSTSSNPHLDAALSSIASSSRPPNPKKPRFDTRNPQALAAAADEEDDADLFLEVDEGAVNKKKTHRNAVELEGYDTDSSEEGFDATRKVWKEDENKKDDDGDDDMFGAASEDEAKPAEMEGGKGKKNVKFLDLHDIEGQEFASRKEYLDIIDEDKGRGEGEDDDEDADQEEVDEEVGQGGLKKHAPKMDAFNMAAEMEEGRFDESGNFVRMKREKDAVHDSWLQGVSRKDVLRAKEAMEKREKDRREGERRRDEVITADVLANLIECLEVGETVLEGLARLGGGKKEKKKAKGWRERKAERERKERGEMEVEEVVEKQEEDPKERRRKEMVEKITEAADILLTRGALEIYEETREGLMRQYLRETGEDWKPRKEEKEEVEEVVEKLWEFRWTDGRDEIVHGPYKGAEMRAWNEHGFFAEGAEFREKGGVEGWTRAPNF